MFIITWIILSITNNTAEVPEWILVSVGIDALIEAAWWALVIIFGIIGAIADRN